MGVGDLADLLMKGSVAKGVMTGALVLFGCFGTVVSIHAQTLWRGLVVAPERRCSSYDAGDYSYPQSVEDRIISQLGGVYGPYTGRWFASQRETDIEHVVARSEAHDSGLCAADTATRRHFATDLLNLTLAAPGVNRYQKGASDAADWLPEQNRCWFTARVIAVRRKYGLTIDQREADALEHVLATCTSTHLVFVARGTAPPTPVGHSNDAVGTDSEALAQWDDNGNGRITCAEARAHGIAPVHRGHPAYGYMRDADGDGVVCEADSRAASDGTARQTPVPSTVTQGGGALSQYDDNGNGRITCAEARAHGIAPVHRGHPAYGYMRDADGDGVVCEADSRAASDGTARQTPVPSTVTQGGGALSQYDDNGNGRITCAEARAHGIAPVRRNHPAYRYMRDADGDGVVCEADSRAASDGTARQTPVPSTVAQGGGALSQYDDNGNGRITCAEARAHGIAPVRRGHPAYRYMRDADGDGIVCE